MTCFVFVDLATDQIVKKEGWKKEKSIIFLNIVTQF